MRLRWVGFGVVLGVGLALVFFAVERRTAVARTFDGPAVVREIQGLSELVSVRYTVQKVVGLEEKKSPVGSEKLLLIVQAEVLAGVDLSTVSAAGIKILPDQNIRVALPPAQILHIVIDDKETKVWDRQITWWTPWVSPNPDLERQARMTATASVKQAALDMGILGQAQRNAESVIRNLLERLGAKSVTVGAT